MCSKCKNTLIAVDILLPGNAVEAEVKCKCGQITKINIINKLQGTSYNWPEDEYVFINRNKKKGNNK